MFCEILHNEIHNCCFSATGDEKKENSAEAHARPRFRSPGGYPLSSINTIIVIAVVAWPIEIVAEIVKEIFSPARGDLGILLHLGDSFAFRLLHTFLRTTRQFGGLLGVLTPAIKQFNGQISVMYGGSYLL